MTNFDADTLRDLRDLQEVHIRTEKHRKSAVVIWVVVADDEVFVRSWRGTKGRWHRDLSAGGPATLEFAGRRLAVLGARRVSAMVVPDRAAPILCEGWKVGPSHYLNQDLGTVWLDQ